MFLYMWNRVECAGKFITEKCNFIGLPLWAGSKFVRTLIFKTIFHGNNLLWGKYNKFPRNSTCKKFYSNSYKKIIFNLHFFPNGQREMVSDISERGLNSFQLCIGYWFKHFLPELIYNVHAHLQSSSKRNSTTLSSPPHLTYMPEEEFHFYKFSNIGYW